MFLMASLHYLETKDDSAASGQIRLRSDEILSRLTLRGENNNKAAVLPYIRPEDGWVFKNKIRSRI